MPEQLTVIDVNSELNLSGEVYDRLAEFYECTNGSYHRWYPDDSWNYPGDELKSAVNDELRKVMVLPEVLHRPVGHPEGYFTYYVLLCFSW